MRSFLLILKEGLRDSLEHFVRNLFFCLQFIIIFAILVIYFTYGSADQLREEKGAEWSQDDGYFLTVTDLIGARYEAFSPNTKDFLRQLDAHDFRSRFLLELQGRYESQFVEVSINYDPMQAESMSSGDTWRLYTPEGEDNDGTLVVPSDSRQAKFPLNQATSVSQKMWMNLYSDYDALPARFLLCLTLDDFLERDFYTTYEVFFRDARINSVDAATQGELIQTFQDTHQGMSLHLDPASARQLRLRENVTSFQLTRVLFYFLLVFCVVALIGSFRFFVQELLYEMAIHFLCGARLAQLYARVGIQLLTILIITDGVIRWLFRIGWQRGFSFYLLALNLIMIGVWLVTMRRYLLQQDLVESLATNDP